LNINYRFGLLEPMLQTSDLFPQLLVLDFDPTSLSLPAALVVAQRRMTAPPILLPPLR
jgi:hypothetical protein